MKRTPVKSSNVVSVGYSGGVLECEFQGGQVYTYHGVPESVHKGLMGAASVGGFIAANVKGKYPFNKGENTVLPADPA